VGSSPSSSTALLGVPNVSEGRDEATVRAIAEAFTQAGDTRLLDVHSDPDHDRSVYTLAGSPGALADALLHGARQAVALVDVLADTGRPRGQHPHVGALDVAPIVYLDEAARGAAIAEALVLADMIGEELSVPVFLYGDLANTDRRSASTRAQLRAGGVAGLARRVDSGELRPDFGPASLHPSAGATLVAAREPLVAFNLQLAPPATLADARAIASLIREGGSEGLPGVRAIGVELAGTGGSPPVAQVSTNVERPLELPLAAVLGQVRAHLPVVGAELVGLAPEAALDGFPADVPIVGFDPERQFYERALKPPRSS
jgi:glutamate formiminotransferase / 5-formyltetrahydrofolate cyclo-ligase